MTVVVGGRPDGPRTSSPPPFGAGGWEGWRGAGRSGPGSAWRGMAVARPHVEGSAPRPRRFPVSRSGAVRADCSGRCVAEALQRGSRPPGSPSSAVRAAAWRRWSPHRPKPIRGGWSVGRRRPRPAHLPEPGGTAASRPALDPALSAGEPSLPPPRGAARRPRQIGRSGPVPLPAKRLRGLWEWSEGVGISLWWHPGTDMARSVGVGLNSGSVRALGRASLLDVSPLFLSNCATWNRISTGGGLWLKKYLIHKFHLGFGGGLETFLPDRQVRALTTAQ